MTITTEHRAQLPRPLRMLLPADLFQHSVDRIVHRLQSMTDGNSITKEFRAWLDGYLYEVVRDVDYDEPYDYDDDDLRTMEAHHRDLDRHMEDWLRPLPMPCGPHWCYSIDVSKTAAERKSGAWKITIEGDKNAPHHRRSYWHRVHCHDPWASGIDMDCFVIESAYPHPRMTIARMARINIRMTNVMDRLMH